ncbi:zonular occludens toxin domain-containing protein [Sulfurimonas sp.]|uniref:zonular occludens toxin domain-containing protein n=1 Tax=Sulfurimonas sp. TaxID=2022749 RepID=UPI0025CEEFAA|nr:zonular occludens toxin domain-containing protein [Sulfurimonas sp.]
MIFGVIGEGGCGKSAITVSIGLDHLHKYDVIFTNIKGFNKDNSIEDIASAKNADIMIKHFENTAFAFQEILEDIEIIQAENSNDEKLKILILYDECHKSLRRFTNTKPEDIYLSDFFSEHRHFHVDFYFLTQGYKKIADMYKGEFKAWYISVDDQKKTSTNEILFKKMDKECKDKVGMKRFKKTRKWKGKSGNLYTVFDCYDSGDGGEKQINQGMSSFAKKLSFFLFALMLFIVSVYFAVGNVTSFLDVDDEPAKAQTTKNKTDSETTILNDNNSSFTYSDRFGLLKKHKEKNTIIADFTIVYCLYDIKRGLYIFDNRILTQKNFDSLNELFLFELLNTQLISENVYKYEYLVNSEISSLLSSKTIKKEKKGFMK